MRTKRISGICLLSLLSSLAFASGAEAQGWLSDRASNSGPGFRLGRLELHPGVATEFGYDNNIFLTDANKEDSTILRVSGYLDISTLTQQRLTDGNADDNRPKVQFSAGVAGSYYHYFSDRVGDNASAEGHLDLGFNPSRVFSVRLHDVFTRTIRPFSDSDETTGRSVGFGRNINAGGVEFTVRSKSEVLQGRLGYTNRYEFFDETIFDYAENLEHQVNGGFNWLFFPTSSLFYAFDVGIQNYLNANAAVRPAQVSDNIRFNNEIGFNGAITEKLSLTAAIGYSVGFFDAGDDFDTVIGRLEARYRPRSTITLRAGFARSATSSFIGNVTKANRLFFDTRFLIAGVFSIGTKTWVSFDRSGTAFSGSGGVLEDGQAQARDRSDIRVGASLFGEYRATQWLAFFAEGGYLADFTDFVFAQPMGMGPMTGTLVDSAGEYQKFEAWGGVRVFY